MPALLPPCTAVNVGNCQHQYSHRRSCSSVYPAFKEGAASLHISSLNTLPRHPCHLENAMAESDLVHVQGLLYSTDRIRMRIVGDAGPCVMLPYFVCCAGTSSVEEVVEMLVAAEESNYSLFNYVNELNSEIEKLEEQIAGIRWGCLAGGRSKYSAFRGAGSFWIHTRYPSLWPGAASHAGKRGCGITPSIGHRPAALVLAATGCREQLLGGL